jgi:hypothetical protein
MPTLLTVAEFPADSAVKTNGCADAEGLLCGDSTTVTGEKSLTTTDLVGFFTNTDFAVALADAKNELR